MKAPEAKTVPIPPQLHESVRQCPSHISNPAPSQGPVPECVGTGPWWLGSIGFCSLVYLLSARGAELGFGHERGSAVTAEAGRLGRSCWCRRHRRRCGRNDVLLGALLTATLLALRLGHCGCHTVRGLCALLADAKDNDRATDDEDDRHATANNKRQVSLDKVENILRQRMGGYWTCRCLREALMSLHRNNQSKSRDRHS